MRVLHVIETLGRGGAEQTLMTLLPALEKHGVATQVAVLRAPVELKSDLEAVGIPVRLSVARHRWALPLVARDIARLAADADIVHAHLFFPAVATGLMRWMRLSGARTCVTFHNLAYAGANAPTRRLAFRRRLARWSYRNGIDQCLGVSQAVAQHYGAILDLPVAVLPNPVDLSVIGEGAAYRPVTGSACRLVMPGRLVREKGHADLLHALALLKDRGLVPDVDIVGGGPLASSLAAQASELGLASQITHHGSVPHSALLDWVRQADIAVVPSRFEGFGLAALEAMALGRATVASNAGGLPDVLGDTGLQVPAGDVTALAKALETLCADPARRAALGQAARLRAARFASDRVAADLRDRYAALLTARDT